MRRFLVAICSQLVISSLALGGEAPCQSAREDVIDANNGVLAGSSRTTPIKLKKIGKVSMSSDLGFVEQAKFTGSYPQFNASWVPVDEWIRLDAQYSEQMLMRKAERDGKRTGSQVLSFATEKDGLNAQKRQELDAVSGVILKEMVAFLKAKYQDEFNKNYEYNEESGDLKSNITGEKFNIKNPTEHPLDIAGRIAQEDLTIIMQDPEGSYRLMAGFLAHPSGWRLKDFLGWTVREIHENAAGLSSKFAGAIDAALTTYHVGTQLVGRMQMRNNWFLVYDRNLKRKIEQREPEGDTTLANVHERVFLRMERETMRAFTAPGVKNRFILFTIKPHVFDLPTIAGQPKTEQLVLGIFDVDEGGPARESMLAARYLYDRLPEEARRRIDEVLAKKWQKNLVKETSP